MTPFQLFREAPLRLRSYWPTLWKVLACSAASTTLAVVLMAWQASRFCREHHHHEAVPMWKADRAQFFKSMSLGCRAIERSRGEALVVARRYAFDAFPSWVAAHPDEQCPSSLDELNGYIGRSDTNDPFGGHYAMACNNGIEVISWGPDGELETADDVRSGR